MNTITEATKTTDNRLAYLERAKIQAEILEPLYRRLKAEVGLDRARAMLKEAVNEFASRLGREIAQGPGSGPLDKLRNFFPAFTDGDALEIEPIQTAKTNLTFKVRRCKYAEFFREFSDPEFGRLMVCGIDPPMTAAIDANLKLERKQTLMEGADHCDFHWYTPPAKS